MRQASPNRVLQQFSICALVSAVDLVVAIGKALQAKGCHMERHADIEPCICVLCNVTSNKRISEN